MPHVSTFVYAEDTIQDNTPQGPRLLIVGPQQILSPLFVPGTYSFSVMFGVVGANMHEAHTLRHIFRTSSAEDPPIVDSGDMPVPPRTEDRDLPEDMDGFMSSLNLKNVVFRAEGTYVSEIFFDGHNIGEFPIKVRGKERHATEG